MNSRILNSLAPPHAIHSFPMKNYDFDAHSSKNYMYDYDALVPVKCETEQKRNGTKPNRSNETKQIEKEQNKWNMSFIFNLNNLIEHR